MPWVTEIDREGTRARRAHQWSIIRNPRVSSTLCCDASATRREREFPRQCWRHIVTDILPGHSVGGAQVREHSIHRVAVRDASQRRPEREAVVEGTRILVHEL